MSNNLFVQLKGHILHLLHPEGLKAGSKGAGNFSQVSDTKLSHAAGYSNWLSAVPKEQYWLCAALLNYTGIDDPRDPVSDCASFGLIIFSSSWVRPNAVRAWVAGWPRAAGPCLEARLLQAIKERNREPAAKGAVSLVIFAVNNWNHWGQNCPCYWLILTPSFSFWY